MLIACLPSWRIEGVDVPSIVKCHLSVPFPFLFSLFLFFIHGRRDLLANIWNIQNVSKFSTVRPSISHHAMFKLKFQMPATAKLPSERCAMVIVIRCVAVVCGRGDRREQRHTCFCTSLSFQYSSSRILGRIEEQAIESEHHQKATISSLQETRLS
jgi:hypothetical protein